MIYFGRGGGVIILFLACLNLVYGQVKILLLWLFAPDIDLSAGRPGEQSIHRVFVDPGGCHCIATIVGPGGADTFYTHAKWTRPRVLSKLKGLLINAVAWNRLQITEGKYIFNFLPFCIVTVPYLAVIINEFSRYSFIVAKLEPFLQLLQGKSFLVPTLANFMKLLWMRRIKRRSTLSFYMS